MESVGSQPCFEARSFHNILFPPPKGAAESEPESDVDFTCCQSVVLASNFKVFKLNQQEGRLGRPNFSIAFLFCNNLSTQYSNNIMLTFFEGAPYPATIWALYHTQRPFLGAIPCPATIFGRCYLP